jgi:PAS domain S-box-containing protein
MAQRHGGGPARIAAIYALVGVLWILLSDRVVAFLYHDQETVTRISIFKGWAFIALTSLLLYLLIRQYAGRIIASEHLLRERNQELLALKEQLQQQLAENVSRQHELSAAHQTLEAIVSASPVAIVALDREGIVTLWNKSAEKLFGWLGDDVLGRPYPLVPPAELEEARKNIEHALQGDVLTDMETRRVGKNGVPLDVSLSVSPLRHSSGDIVGVIIIFADITERKRAAAKILTLNAELEERVRTRTAELEAANRELEAFSYSVSHDLRAPLRHLDGYSSLLREEYGDRLDAPGRNCLERIGAAVRKMDNLVSDMLQLARVSREGVAKGVVDLSSMATEILEELQHAQPGRSVAGRITPDIEAWGDPHLLRLAMENLLANAWKYTGKKEGAVIEFGVTEQEGERVYFVRDNGVGFDMAYVGSLFGPFQRLHPAEEFEGTGVGLATVQRIIQRHGGRIWAQGEEGRGAAFFFTLHGAP